MMTRLTDSIDMTR